MLLLGIDLGTSSIKASVVDAVTRKTLASVHYPDAETPIMIPSPGWAEQSPETWWDHVRGAIQRANNTGAYDPRDIGAIGIAYQMHGLVMLDASGRVLRPAIIWCDSRAVETGEKALDAIGKGRALNHLLNSPGNFTASKLGWVKANEPETYQKTAHIMLPGDYIAYRLTGEMTTSISALSEGIFWDFREDKLSPDVFNYFGFDKALIPQIQPVFAEHGKLRVDDLGLKIGIPVTYKAGDQPNNALSLNVLQPGEVAATAGTSGVIYGVTDELIYDVESRVNTFAHVNYSKDLKRLGVLLCINGTGILNRWVRDNVAGGLSYEAINREAASIPRGSDGLQIFPFGNGAERMLGNKIPGAAMRSLDLNVHHRAHLFRAAQEGIAFAFRYGLDILKENGMTPQRIRAGMANMFLSPVFTEVFTDITGVPLDIYDSDGSMGAALGAGIGAGILQEASPPRIRTVEPDAAHPYEQFYQNWKQSID